jgi:amino acid transporter
MKRKCKSKSTFAEKVYSSVIGAPLDLNDKRIFHKLALIPFFAWIGLGADGLSSSAYGPEEAFKALGTHTYLLLFLALATSITVLVISYAYSKIIEHFPHGGGGYIVATHTLGEKAGVVSGCALIVDYMLTITVSIVSCVNSIFSYFPLSYQVYKLPVACLLIVFLIILNIRGVKESITILAPIFIVFLITHILMIGYGIFHNMGAIGAIAGDVHTNFTRDVSSMGALALFLIFIRAYSFGGGTYTGIEAVSNGMQIMRDPKVNTGKRTMLYMAVSLSLTAGGLFLCYLLTKISPVNGQTLNAVLADAVFGHWKIGSAIAIITILSEGAILLVAAQTGFIDGPRVIANMAVDSWFPHRFGTFSERLTMRNGVLLMGLAAVLLTIYTRGNISALIVMYSINVFLTFSLSVFGMSRFFIKNKKEEPKWKQQLSIQLVALVLCMTILAITIYEKFTEGGWLTLTITFLLVMLCYTIHAHYMKIKDGIRKLEKVLVDLPKNNHKSPKPLKSNDMTAIQLVSSYNGLGVQTFLAVNRSFHGLYKNYIFASVGIVNQGLFKGKEGFDDLHCNVEENLKKYVDLARSMGYAADYRIAVGTDLVESAANLCIDITKEFKQSTVFSGQITFTLEKFYHKLLHNQSAYAIQRKLQMAGINIVIMPIKID